MYCEDEIFIKIFLDTCSANFNDFIFAAVNNKFDVIYASQKFLNFVKLNKVDNLESYQNDFVKIRMINEINKLVNKNTTYKSRIILRIIDDVFAEVNFNLIINPYTNNQLLTTISVNPYQQNDLLLQIRKSNSFNFSQINYAGQDFNVNKLTEYQKAICHLLVQGFTNLEISQIISSLKTNYKISKNGSRNNIETTRIAINRQVSDIRELIGCPSKESLIAFLIEKEFQKKLPKFIYGDEIVLN